jgi:mannose-6-phosphate isomerase-like protein (cupin superfamily)
MDEAEIETTPEGKVPADGGWFVLNLGEMAWETFPPYGAALAFEPGIHVHVLQPGECNGYYHAEDAQEGFLVLSGECVAVIENEERRLRQWDYFRSPPGTEHITIGAGKEPSRSSCSEPRTLRAGSRGSPTRSRPSTAQASSGRPATGPRSTATCPRPSASARRARSARPRTDAPRFFG